MTSRWIARGPARPGAHRLYFFPHAGGSAGEYLYWAKPVERAAPHAVQLPGRGTRIGEAPVHDLGKLVAELAGTGEFTGEYSFFGHSFGSLLAYELTCALRDAGLPLPRRLVVSSAPAPHIRRTFLGVEGMDDDELLAAVQARHGGIPEEVLAYPEMRTLIAVSLRADYTALETYSWPGHAPLPVPVTVLAGADEELARGDGPAAWSEHTTAGAVDVRTFPGGHFYLRGDGAPAVREVLGSLF
ncbi:thioesterase [Streptomyces griseocarneus]|nr:thioesterase [Streptomyces griseocarneus]